MAYCTLGQSAQITFLKRLFRPTITYLLGTKYVRGSYYPSEYIGRDHAGTLKDLGKTIFHCWIVEVLRGREVLE